MRTADRIKKLETQMSPKVDIAARLVASRNQPRPEPERTRAELEEIARTARDGSLRKRLAEAQLRVGLFR